MQLAKLVNLKPLSDETIFAHDCLRFASGGNREESYTIGCNRMKSYLIRWNREESEAVNSDL